MTTHIFCRFFELDFKSGAITLGPNGDAPVSMTTREDAGRFTAHVLTTVSPSKLENSIWRMEGDRIVRAIFSYTSVSHSDPHLGQSFNDIAKGWEARSGQKINITYTDKKELEENVKKDPRSTLR